jgi:4-hydroxythreonine-4-phosphate dehydrogenase
LPIKPNIAISLGDPNGIGPEVTLKSLADLRLLRYLHPVLIGSEAVTRQHAKRLSLAVPEWTAITPSQARDYFGQTELGAATFIEVGAGDEAVAWGETTATAGRLSMRAVEMGIDLCLEARTDALVTAPISKESIAQAGYDTPGHTEFLARRTGAEETLMMLVAGTMRVGLVTVHIPISEVAERVTQEAIAERVELLSYSLRTDFGVERPHIALLGLNPHAGDGGVMGREEETVIVPAMRRCREAGHLVSGPFPADGFFGMAAYRNYDAVLAMYHDQGLVPFKTLAFDTGVNFTAGLPIVRTSPDHGTAFGIAGQAVANPGSMRSALYLALDVARRRQYLRAS